MSRGALACAAASAAVLLGAGRAVATPRMPAFSWDTVPVFYHSCNYSGPFSADAVGIIAKFPLVVIEKGMAVDQPGFAEDKIAAALAAVKAVSPNVSGVFYYNSAMDWPFYRMHEEFLQHPEWWLRRWPGGEVVRIDGDNSFPNHTNMLSFDFAQGAMQRFFASECVNMTQTGVVDGCFIDQASGCRNGNASCAAGHMKMFQDLQESIPTGLVISNNAVIDGVKGTMMEEFSPTSADIARLQQVAAGGTLVQAHRYGGQCTGDAFVSSLAAFLVGAGELSFFGCSSHWSVQSDPVATAWHAEYDKPLGAPLGPGVQGADGVWSRTFAGGSNGRTVVTFDGNAGTGSIAWDGAPAPPPPPPPPPPPVPASCGAVLANTGQANAEISVRRAGTAAECCAACEATGKCEAWAWHTEQGNACHLHTAAATANPHKGCFSGRLNRTRADVGGGRPRP